MKRFVAFILVVVMFSFGTLAMASDGTLTQWVSSSRNNYTGNNNPLRVARPSVRMTSEKGTGRLLITLHFGDKVTLLLQEGDYCLVTEPNSGATGYVATQYLVYAKQYIWLGQSGVALSPRPGMTSFDLGYAAGGMRTNEEAIVLYEDYGGSYWYVVTEDGYSGYVYRYDPAISFVISK